MRWSLGFWRRFVRELLISTLYAVFVTWLSPVSVFCAESVTPQELAKALREGEPSERIAVAGKLAVLGAGMKEIAPDLAKGLGDDYHVVRMNCRLALTALGRDAVPHVRKIVVNGSYYERVNALCVLGELGSGARDALPEIRHALAHEDWQTRSKAMDVLGRMGPKEQVLALDTLLGMLDDPHLPGGAVERIRQIARSDPESRGKVESAMRRHLKSEDPDQIMFALEMLETMGARLSEADLVDAMKRTASHNPERLLEMVKREKTGAAWAVPILIELLEGDGGEWDVARLCDALFLIGPASAPAVPSLIRALYHPKPGAQRYAARTLGMLGGKSRSALPRLRNLQESTKDARVRQWTADAIKTIEAAE